MADPTDLEASGLKEAWKLHRKEAFPPLAVEPSPGGHLLKGVSLSPEYGANVIGFEFVHDSEKAALVSMSFGAEQAIPLGDLLLQRRPEESTPWLAVTNLLALKNAELVVASYGFARLPKIGESIAMPDAIAETVKRMLPSGSSEWRGLHFRGDLTLRPDFPGTTKELLKMILPEGVICQGSIRSSGLDSFLSIECAVKDESFPLRPGTDWNLAFKSLAISFLVSDGRICLGQIRARGSLVLGGNQETIEAMADLDQGTLLITAHPNWNVDLGWLKKFAGAEDFAHGAGTVLESKTGENSDFFGATFSVSQITARIAWQPKIAARAFSVTIANPKANGQFVKWKLLGGLFDASLTGSWSRDTDGESSFDCAVEGSWQWETLHFAASLDTSSGEFYAGLNLNSRKTDFAAFAKKKLFPGTELQEPQKNATANPPDEAKLTAEEEASLSKEEKKRVLGERKKEIIAAKLARPFEIVYFDVSGNYREKTIEAQLQTAGYFGFRLRGKDGLDPHRVDVRIGDLICKGRYDQSSENAAWSLQVAGTFALLGGGEPCGLGEGARVRGKFGTDGTELSLTLRNLNLGELVGLVMADDPPAALKNVKLTEIEILYRASEKFSVKCKSDIPLFGPASLKGLQLDLVTGEEKKPEATPTGEPPKPAGPKKEKPVNSGSATIGFGKTLTVDLKVEFKDKEIKFTGSAKKIDVSELIEGFFQEKPIPPVGTTTTPVAPPAKKEEKEPAKLIAKEIKVAFSLARGKSQPTEPSDGNALVVTVELEHGKSSLKLLLVAAGIPSSEKDGKTEWKVLFAGELDLRARSLPLIGDLLGDKADSFGIKLHALHVEKGGAAPETAKKLIARGGDGLADVWKTADKKEPQDWKDGFNIKADISPVPLTDLIPASSSPQAQPENGPASPGTPSPASPPPTGKGLTWTNTNLRLGPLHLSRIGYGTDEAPPAGKQIGKVSLDAALDLGVLRLAVIGLGLDVEFPSFQATPRLEGLALNVRNGPLEITGALVYRNGVFSGLARVKAATFTLGAVGRFSLQGERPSFFIYCVYASPLGGPPAFFIEGLAGGMGYDTRLVMPEVDAVPDFALVKAAKEGMAGSAEKQIASFDKAIATAPNNLWIAAGVRFTSFKILDSVVVIAFSIGDDIEVDIFGVMSLRTPPPLSKSVPAPFTIASADLAIRGKLSPRKGELWLRGQIMPGAFLFDKKCRLKGGFAFQTWFSGEHRGDFVATVGGYHPQFKKPAHYFDVPRFGIEWQLTTELSIKGEAYMAITSRAIMAGGRLEMLYQSGSIRASFVAEAHFLMAWAPLYYQADVRIAVDASFSIKVWRWTKDFHVHIAAQLHLEGPPFSGFAKLELGPIDIQINFGSTATPVPLKWKEFAGQFLPAPEAVISVRGSGIDKAPDETSGKPATTSALAGTGPVRTNWVAPPGRDWELTIQTVVPVTKLQVGDFKKDHPTFYAVPTLKEVTVSAVTITGDLAALGITISEASFITEPLAPALWSVERPPDAKHSPPSPDRDPRLNPPDMQSAPQGLVGIVLKRSKARPRVRYSGQGGAETDLVIPDVRKREPVLRTTQLPKAVPARTWNPARGDIFAEEKTYAATPIPSRS